VISALEDIFLRLVKIGLRNGLEIVERSIYGWDEATLYYRMLVEMDDESICERAVRICVITISRKVTNVNKEKLDTLTQTVHLRYLNHPSR
jgi:hypothetical protein